MKHGSLFSGIGGFDLAAQWMGWENVFQVEVDPFCQRVLEKNFPNTKRYGDIKEFDGTKYRGTIDILTGGFPCQPFSSAGSRKGSSDDRHLWPEMLRVIREIYPAIIVGENVYGLLTWSRGMVFEQIQVDLENEGYEIQSVILPACAINAPHRRDRVWVIAHAKGNGNNRGCRSFCESNGGSISEMLSKFNSTNAEFTSDTSSIRCQRNISEWQRLQWGKQSFRKTWTSNYSDWIINKEGQLIESPFCGDNDGVSAELDEYRLESLGNAIVPQVAFGNLQSNKTLNIMTQTETRLLSLAELIGAYLDSQYEGNEIITEALNDKMLKDSLSIQKEFENKVKTDGRKNPAKKEKQPELGLK